MSVEFNVIIYDFDYKFNYQLKKIKSNYFVCIVLTAAAAALDFGMSKRGTFCTNAIFCMFLLV